MANRSETETLDWMLSLKLANQNSALAKELLTLLIAELPQTQNQIKQAQRAKNYALLQQYIHKLHGATCYCGVPRLKEITTILEKSLKKPEAEPIKRCLATLYAEIERLIVLVKQQNLL